MRGRTRLLHTHVLLRGGARTPLRPIGDESFWRSALPDDELVGRIWRTGALPAGGARRPRRPKVSESTWGQLTTLGIDEAQGLGKRLQSWMLDRSALPMHEDDPPQTMAIMVLSTPDARSVLTARAVLNGLEIPESESVPVDTSQESVLRVARGLEAPELLATREEVPRKLRMDPEVSSEEVALDLLEALGGSPDELEDCDWPRLLDIAESSALFGLLPRVALTEAMWPSLLAAPCRMAASLLEHDKEARRRAAKLVRLMLISSIRASRGIATEHVRISVLPGFSLLCLSQVLQLEPMSSMWPTPCTALLVETLIDEEQTLFLRFWRMRDMWELRPAGFPAADGPVPLMQLLESFQHGDGHPPDEDTEPIVYS